MRKRKLPFGEPLHIGEMVKNYIDKSKVAKSALARKIHTNDNTILRYQKSASLQSSILIELSHALKHNFFADIAALLPETYHTDVVSDNTDKERIAQLEQEIALLKAKNETLMEVVKGKQ